MCDKKSLMISVQQIIYFSTVEIPGVMLWKRWVRMVQREKRERPTERARLAGGAGQEGPSSCPCSARKPVACSRNEATSSWFHSTIFCPSVNESNNAGRHTVNSRGIGHNIGLNVPLSDQKTSWLTSYIHLHLHTIDYCWFRCCT